MDIDPITLEPIIDNDVIIINKCKYNRESITKWIKYQKSRDKIDIYRTKIPQDIINKLNIYDFEINDKYIIFKKKINKDDICIFKNNKYIYIFKTYMPNVIYYNIFGYSNNKLLSIPINSIDKIIDDIKDLPYNCEII